MAASPIPSQRRRGGSAVFVYDWIGTAKYRVEDLNLDNTQRVVIASDIIRRVDKKYI